MLFKFACYFPSQDHPNFVVVNASLDDWFAELVKAIQQELQMCGRVVARNDLRLYKVTLFSSGKRRANPQQADIPLQPDSDLQQRALQWLHQQPPGSDLPVTATIESSFPSGPIPKNRIHIIVATPERMLYTVLYPILLILMSVLQSLEDLGDPHDVYQRKLKKGLHITEISYLSYSCALALDQSLDRLTPGSSPSEIVHSPDKVASLLGDKSLIHLNGPPATIFSPALAGLQRNLENLEEIKVSWNDVDCAAKYLRCAIDFYKDEAQRQKAIMDLINEAIGQNGEWGYALAWADGIKPDGCWWHDLFLVQILELKNTLGILGDALLQAIADYSKIVAREKVQSPILVPSNPIAYLGLQYKPFRGYSNFPIVLVGATANRLEICIAVCVGPIYVSKLLALDLSLGFHASDNIVRLARVFQALSLCCKHLKVYYDGVRNSAPPKLSGLYPNPTPADLSNPPPQAHLPAISVTSWSTDFSSCGPQEHNHRHVHRHP